MSDVEANPSAVLSPPPKGPDGEPSKQLAGRVFENPALLIAGGLALGLLAGALLPRGAAGKLAQRARKIAAAAGEIGLALGHHAREPAGETALEGQEEIEHEETGPARPRTSRLAGGTRGAGIRLAREAIRIAGRFKR